MSRISFEIPDDVAQVAAEQGLADLAREALLVRLYALSKLSSGRCAELLRCSRREFLELAEQYGVPVLAEPADLQEEASRGAV